MPRNSTVELQTPEELGRAIRDRRTKLGLDQGSLARLVGVSRQWIVEIEQGKPRAEVGLLLRTLSALGLTLTLKTLTRKTEDKTATETKTENPSSATPEVYAPGLVDLDALIRRARGQGP